LNGAKPSALLRCWGGLPHTPDEAECVEAARAANTLRWYRSYRRVQLCGLVLREADEQAERALQTLFHASMERSV
jgi:hypothetical protein